MTRAPEPSPSRARVLVAFVAAFLLILPASSLRAQSLRGSPASMDRQDHAADKNDFTFIRTPAQLRSFVKHGWLVRVRPDANFSLHAVSYPYARPQVALFIRRLASEYRVACGRQLVVTSLTRPEDRQPDNASERSVHPTGMAVDLRYPGTRACRTWLERVLLQLEGSGVLEATREHYPPHFHVAVFPQQYASYVASLEVHKATDDTHVASVSYKVRSGDSLWAIAVTHGTTVDALRERNDLSGNRILPGQVLEVPNSG
jgi:LysM repeat protein